MKPLTGKQVRQLRGLGHHLNPVVMIGRNDISDEITRVTDEALEAHELIKVRLQEGCDLDRKEAARLLAEATGSAVVQILGKTILLYRPSEKNRIDLSK